MAITKSSFQIKEYFIEKLEYTKNESFKKETKNTEIPINFKRNIDSDFNNKKAIVRLSVEVLKKSDAFPFYINIELSGEFKADENMSEELFNRMCNINAPAILFPYVRTIVNTITAQSGFMPLTLPMINIVETLKESE